MAPMNLFAWQKLRCRHRGQICGQCEKERAGRIEKVAQKHTSPYVKQKSSWTSLLDGRELNRMLCDHLGGEIVWGLGALESRRVSLGAHWVDSRESSLLRRLERGREIGL